MMISEDILHPVLLSRSNLERFVFLDALVP